ncbi:Hypothetical predicted protein [Mytilus galloprovincialis]|uniref:RNase H type-1 domain-containing protein n=1 Tax=Mytilus galloprovincialis TaxID=29158 RepID=A0A8B6H9E4_MYTGA|nr:Hypothetical predicted protein [Mytilus galloprovincialis]
MKNTCNEQSSFVKRSLIDAGFLINEEKSVFKPVTELEWLGIVWNSKEYKLSITQRRVDDLISSLNVILAKFPYVTARSLAQVVGRIISMTPVIGNVARIMSKFCYMEIESRIGWDIPITGYKPVEVLSELKFWLENVTMINYRKLGHYSKSSVVIYSDASNIAAGAYTVELENKIFHKMWTCSETVQSSTWRELKAIELALFSFKNSFTGKTIKWFTDNQNCVKIVNSGIGQWSDFNSQVASNNDLSSLFNQLPEFLLSSKAESTQKKYRYAFNSWYVRIACMCLLAYAGFLRFSELA